MTHEQGCAGEPCSCLTILRGERDFLKQRLAAYEPRDVPEMLMGDRERVLTRQVRQLEGEKTELSRRLRMLTAADANLIPESWAEKVARENAQLQRKVERFVEFLREEQLRCGGYNACDWNTLSCQRCGITQERWLTIDRFIDEMSSASLTAGPDSARSVTEENTALREALEVVREERRAGFGGTGLRTEAEIDKLINNALVGYSGGVRR